MIPTTAPGYESFAATLLSSPAAEDVAWHPADGEPKFIRAIARQKRHAWTEARASIATVSSINTLRVSANDVPGIGDGDSFTVRGTTYRVARDGVRPDGVALVAVDLEETPR